MYPILVIGGGISGATAAVELAEAGREVILVERSPHLGGNVVKMHSYFPKLCPPACGMEINFRRIRNNPRIRVLTDTTVKRISGPRGKLSVELARAPQRVNDNCTACGECSAVCPEERPDAFNYGFGTTRAIYLPNPLAFPQKYTIDAGHCAGAACSKCVAACSYGAIDLEAGEQRETLTVHAVIAATGWTHYDPSRIGALQYDHSPDIVTNVEFERLLSVTGPGEGKLRRPSDGKPPASIAFVQCAGSRDRNHLPYCSAVCCSASLKHALNVTEMLPGTRVTIFYIDLRVMGRNEDLLNRVEQSDRISLVNGKVASVAVPYESSSAQPASTISAIETASTTKMQKGAAAGEISGSDSQIAVTAEDPASGKKIHQRFDLVVLATGIMPSDGVPGLKMNEHGFYDADQDEGIYPAACARRPVDVSASVKDATAAALKAMK